MIYDVGANFCNICLRIILDALALDEFVVELN